MKRLLAFLLTCTSIAHAGDLVAYRLKAMGTTPSGKAFTSLATCFPVGAIDGGGTLLVGARHTLEDADRAQVSIDRKWYPVRRIIECKTDDLVAIEIDHEPGQALDFGEAKTGLSVRLLGYGSEYQGGKMEALSGRLVSQDQMIGQNGHHAINGDSGAPVVDLLGRVLGVCSEVQWTTTKTASRSDYAGQDAKTNLVPIERVESFLAQYYQRSCGPDGCTIWMGGGVQSWPQQRPAPVVVQPQRPAVDNEAVLRDEVRKWLAANAAALKGKDGKDGRDGVDATADTRPLTVQLRRGGKVFRQQEYLPGDTMFLNVEDLTTGGSK